MNGPHYSAAKDGLGGIGFTPDGRLLIETELGRVRMVDPATGQVVWHGHGSGPLSAEPRRRLVLYAPSGGLVLRHPTTGAEVAGLPAGAAPWTERTLSPDGRKLLTLRLLPMEQPKRPGFGQSASRAEAESRSLRGEACGTWKMADP